MISKDSTNLNMLRRMNRRTFLKVAGVATGTIALGGVAMRQAFGALPPTTGCGIQEFQPYVTSPFILKPFTDALPIPTAMAPGYRPRVAGEADWTVRKSPLGLNPSPPSPDLSRQDSYGHHLEGDLLADGQHVAVEHAGTHQIWPVPGLGANAANFSRLTNWPLAAQVPPILYHIRLQLRRHSFTSSPVRVMADFRDPTGKLFKAGTVVPNLPDSAIYGFNGTFPGPMINVEYGKPVLVRFENDLDLNPLNLDRQDFGAPDFAFLTHLHNGHTAPESDGQPHYMQINDGGYIPTDWVDNLYLNYPAGGNPAEIQSFLWFHDHRMHFTGANVFKGMVGLMPHYDTGIIPGSGMDTGNEADPAPNLKLPGVKTVNPDGTFDVKYDIPMALYDTALDDGVTPHADEHIPLVDCGKAHPEWWGKTFFRHWPNHGFVGDVFTVNCTAYPVLHVEPRRYRFRFLDASVSRIYELCLMTSAAGPVEKPGTQGQWQIPDGVQWLDGTPNPKSWVRIASMGGLLPKALVTNTVHVWPANRREVVVDFTKVPKGTVIYLTNVLQMVDGREPAFNDLTKPIDQLPYKVPMMKIVVDQPLAGPDNSVPIVDQTLLKPMPVIPDAAGLAALPHTTFELTRGGPDTESQWVINGLPFNALVPLHTVFRGQPEVWTNKNGGGGWVHPMHMHMEENTVLERVGSTLQFPLDPVRAHPDDTGKEDVTDLEPSEAVTFYRNFRTFEGRYVAHCHNLAHEDHNMMFGWSILAPPAAGTFALSGTVKDSAGAGIPGVVMTLTNAAGTVGTTPTDATGNYSIAGLAPGNYVVTPTKAGFTFVPTSASVGITTSNVIVPNFVGTAVAFLIFGQVTNKVNTPLGRVPMTLTNAAGSVLATQNTDAFGHYTFAGLANGNYTVTPNAANTLKGFTFVPTSLVVNINGADMLGQNFTTTNKKVT